MGGCSIGRGLLVCVFGLVAAAPAYAERVIIKCTRPCTAAVNAVERNGGTVIYRYRYIDAIAADVQRPALTALRLVVPAGAIRKDIIVYLSDSPRDRNGATLLAHADARSVAALSESAVSGLAASQPNAYLVNNALMNLGAVHAAGFTGTGMKVAVIDSGIRPGRPHLSLDGSVIGGEDFVGDGLGFSNAANGGHGTFVAGMISSAVIFNFAPGTLLSSVATHCPGCIGPAANQIAMIGSAPSSSIYALRVFGPTGGSPTSRIMAAMEQVLTLRENFDNGVPETLNADGSYEALNVSVCNMSLGGPTLYAGRDLEDQLTNAFLARDIVLVTSAGNAGPSGSTGGSPGTGFGALTVGAASTPIHERILRDVQFGLGTGFAYRPFDGIQTAYFSSRGPTADGRVDPDVVSNGFASFGMGFSASPFGISIGSGTSFSAPSVAGVAAVLRQAVPTASARQVRFAMIKAADATLISDGSGRLDQGTGFVDAGKALLALQAWSVPDVPGAPGGTNTNVRVNILQGAGVPTFSGNVTRTVQDLLPGQRLDTYYRVQDNASAVIVTLSNVTPGGPQNPLFGDDILLTVHSAKTSAIGQGDYNVFAFTTGGQFVIPNPDLGLMRVTLNGDWTNASPIDARVNIRTVISSESGRTSKGPIDDGDVIVVPFTVPQGASTLDVRLDWRGDWDNYPTNDIDVILLGPGGIVNFDGATLNNPERVVIPNVTPGNWTAFVDGFSIATRGGDKYTLRVAVDGKVLR